jgi:hypothetical protein
MLKKIVTFFIFICVLHIQAQLGFCKGNSGDPIFLEDFGTGSVDSYLESGSTTYTFAKGAPKDGYYKVSKNTNYYGWFITRDHTPEDIDGRCLIVNASNTPGEFFNLPVSGLCENTTYEFSSWLINLFPSQNKVCGPFGNQSANPINITYEIWDSTNTQLLKKGDTGNIYGSSFPKWKQYGMVFQTKPGQTSVILKIKNNGKGGCGNDLAIDDILFRTCGDAVFIEEKITENAVELIATPDFSVFSTHFFQWQKSTNGKDWGNILNENKNTILIKTLGEVKYFRVLLAEDAVNLSNSSCNSSSEIYKVSNNVQQELKPKLKLKKIKPIISSKKGKRRTEKEVIIVKNGLTIIKHKVWIYGARGKFVKTGEKITKKGDKGAGFRVTETVYYKSIYGYNSSKRVYLID